MKRMHWLIECLTHSLIHAVNRIEADNLNRLAHFEFQQTLHSDVAPPMRALSENQQRTSGSRSSSAVSSSPPASQRAWSVADCTQCDFESNSLSPQQHGNRLRMSKQKPTAS
jgi:hypothetical protein